MGSTASIMMSTNKSTRKVQTSLAKKAHYPCITRILDLEIQFGGPDHHKKLHWVMAEFPNRQSA